MRVVKRILPFMILLIPAICHSQETCLWMNAATAGGILGGVATVTVSTMKTDVTNTHTANAKSSSGPTSANGAASSYLKNGVDDSDCTFVLRAGPVAAELRIEVRTMVNPNKEFATFLARCGVKATALKALGNEASACLIDGKDGQTAEQVVGRVRDRVFVLRLSTSDKLGQGVLDEKVRRASDIVAGNLF